MAGRGLGSRAGLLDLLQSALYLFIPVNYWFYAGVLWFIIEMRRNESVCGCYAEGNAFDKICGDYWLLIIEIRRKHNCAWNPGFVS